MTYTIPLKDCMSIMKSLARELRQKRCVPEEENIWLYITQEHGINVKYGSLVDNDPHFAPTTVTFPSEAYYTMLVLRWS